MQKTQCPICRAKVCPKGQKRILGTFQLYQNQADVRHDGEDDSGNESDGSE